MKIAVCSLYINAWYREIVQYGKKTLEQYCDKHGYTFICETEDTLDGVYDGSRDAPWFKLKLIAKIMDTGEYDVVVWNDADSVIVSDVRRLEYYIDMYMAGYDILLCSEYGSVLNTGTMFVRNTVKSRHIIELAWNNSCGNAQFHEQGSLTDLYVRNVSDIRDSIRVLTADKQNEFLSYWFTYYPGKCFIMHAARCAHDRIGFVYMMDMFCPIKMDEETIVQYTNRITWMNDSDLCRRDIESYRCGAQRSNMTDRYWKYIRKYG